MRLSGAKALVRNVTRTVGTLSIRIYLSEDEKRGKMVAVAKALYALYADVERSVHQALPTVL